MKYAITPDNEIHQVTDEKRFYELNPNAEEIVTLINNHFGQEEDGVYFETGKDLIEGERLCPLCDVEVNE